MEIRRPDERTITTFQEFADGGCEARMFTLVDGRWEPPLPVDVLRQLPAERSRSGGRATLERLGGATSFGAARTRQRTPSRKPKTVLGRRPVERSVELREHYVDYRVTLGTSAREAIVTEIKRAHRDAGQAVEAAGWLFGQYRPRADGDWTEVALATRSTERSGTRGEVYLSDPIEALAAVRNAGYPHLQLVGDWHSHTHPGSELPSLQDAKAWCGQMDALARDAYVSVLVSPSKQMGWTLPQFSGWIAGRYGSPSRPVVGRARIAC